MKLFLLFLLIIFSISGNCAGMSNSYNVSNENIETILPANIDCTKTAAKNLNRHKPRFHEKKGIMGWVMSLTLGPVGYATVRIFSHEEVTIENSKKGLRIWGASVFCVGIIFLGAITKSPVNDFFSNFLQAFAQGY